MKFIITLQKQILGSFYFAQVKKDFFFPPQRDKGGDGGGGLYRGGWKSGSSGWFLARGVLQLRPQSPLAEQ